jgi:hypothetical protein
MFIIIYIYIWVKGPIYKFLPRAPEISGTPLFKDYSCSGLNNWFYVMLVKTSTNN